MEEHPSRTKMKQCQRSMISKRPVCFVCGKENVELHHVFGGDLREKSEEYGLTVCLCKEHHRGEKGVHGKNKALNVALKKLAEAIFAERYGHSKFLTLFGSDSLYFDEHGDMYSSHRMKPKKRRPKHLK